MNAFGLAPVAEPFAAAATAPALAPASVPEASAAVQPAPAVQPAMEEPPQPPTYQPSLFRDAANGPKVIPIPRLTPVRPRSAEPKEDRARKPRTPRQGARRGPSPQQSLDFFEVNGPGRGDPIGPPVQIYTDAPVAVPSHRAIAACADGSLVALAAGVFIGVFVAAGGTIEFTRQTVPLLIAALVVLALFYKLLWALAGGDSPGMRFAGLRVVDFDGRPPSRDQRVVRQTVSLLSLGSVGLGILWALVDDESLTWHDHISKTFPTPRV